MPDAPQLCDSPIIFMKFNCHNEALLERKYFTGIVPLLTKTTVLGHLLVQRLSPPPQILRKLVGKSSSGFEDLYIQKNHHEIPYPECPYRILKQ